jgi:hypothetical protein
MTENKPMTVKRFPGCNYSENCIQEQGASKNFLAGMAFVQLKIFGVLQWRWPDGLAERLAPSLTFLLHFFCQEKKWKEILSIYDHQFRIIQHNFLLAILIKLYCSNRIVNRTFQFYHCSKSKLLVLHSHIFFQLCNITGNKIW